MPRAQRGFGLKTLIETLANDIADVKPNLYLYNQGEVKNEKQLIFHQSDKRGRLYIGANRSGKTVGGVVEDIWWMLGEHPYLSGLPEPPIYGRLVTVDFKTGWNQITQPVVRQWLPPSKLINGSWEDSYDKVNHVLTLANGSQLEVKSWDQDIESFAGVPRHFIHFDEEPPRNIYNECMLRLVDYNGRWWMTMTPLDGMDWTFDVLYEPAVLGQNPLIDVVEVEQSDNPFIDAESAAAAVADLGDDEQVEIRSKGKYLPLGGIIFTNYDRDVHVIDPVIPRGKEWVHWESLDHGFSNPTAWLWHAVHQPSGVVVTYDMHYKSQMTVKQHAAVVKEREAQLAKKFGIVPYLRVADPAIEQRSATTGLSIRMTYALEGINISLGRLRNVEAGLDRMNTYFSENKWFITSNCEPLLKEIRKYRIKRFDSSKVREKNNAQEKPVKKDDHAIDSCRYFFSYMPILNPAPGRPPSMDRQKLATLLGTGGSAVDLNRDYRIDTNLLKSPVHTVQNYESTVGDF